MSANRLASVSVVIPAYNASSFLTRAVDSAVLQGESVREIIIVDNNSTDGTAGLIDELVLRHGELIVKATCSTQGSSAARNLGIKLARCEWIQFLDADDYLYEDKINRQLSLLEAATDWVIGVSDVVVDGKVVTSFSHEEDLWKGLALCRGVGDTNGNLFRKQAIVSVGCFDENRAVGEDYHLYFKLLQGGHGYVRDHQAASAYVQHVGYRGEGRGDLARFKYRLRFVTEVTSFLETQKTAYYQSELPFYTSARVSALRMYLTGDFKEGVEKLKMTLNLPLEWTKMDTSVLPRYWPLYRLVGFTRVEWVRVKIYRPIRATLLKLFPSQRIGL